MPNTEAGSRHAHECDTNDDIHGTREGGHMRQADDERDESTAHREDREASDNHHDGTSKGGRDHHDVTSKGGRVRQGDGEVVQTNTRPRCESNAEINDGTLEVSGHMTQGGIEMNGRSSQRAKIYERGRAGQGAALALLNVKKTQDGNVWKADSASDDASLGHGDGQVNESSERRQVCEGASAREGACEGASARQSGGVLEESIEQPQTQTETWRMKIKPRTRCGYTGCRDPMKSEILYALTADVAGVVAGGRSCFDLVNKMVCEACFERFCRTGVHVCMCVVCVYV
jgi:hypothetical protein